MIFGDKSVFAVESTLTKAYARVSLRALGFFVIHIGGRSYGVRSPDATMLACSFDAVHDRIERRGTHIAAFATHGTADKIAEAFRESIYSADRETKKFFGFSQRAFSEMFYSNQLIWAPDGDQAFDDGSYVLQFDVMDRVRLIAFKATKSQGYDSDTLGDVWIEADQFYVILQRWWHAFEAEWVAAVRGANGARSQERIS